METAVSNQRTTLPVAVETAATRSALDNATNRIFSSVVSSIAVGCEPDAIVSCGWSSGIQRDIIPFCKSSSAILDRFHRLHHARRPSLDATTVYGNEAGIV